MKNNTMKKNIILLVILSFFMIFTACASISYDQREESRIDKDPERRESIHSLSGHKIGPY
jgi:hypothetical protein